MKNHLSTGKRLKFLAGISVSSFFTNEGSGFSAHLENESLILTTIRQKDKGFRHQLVVHFAERTVSSSNLNIPNA